MNEGNGYATKDGILSSTRKPRTYSDVEIPGLGKFKLQTITAGEFARIDGAQNRAIMLLSRDGVRSRLYIDAINSVFLEIVKAIVAEPVFSDDDAELLLSLDSSDADALKEACLSHARLNQANLEAAQKK